VKKYAQENGADFIRINQYTGFSTPTEYYRETTSLERTFLAESVKQFEEEESERNSKILSALFDN
jgi:predicted TIM-barrel enzyme